MLPPLNPKDRNMWYPTTTLNGITTEDLTWIFTSVRKPKISHGFTCC